MQIIQLTKGLVSTIDDCDFELVSNHKWYADIGPWTVYAKNDSLPFRPRLHVFIMKPPPKLIVHHKDGNGLNNMRDNLEIMTQAEHSYLSSLRRNKKGSKYRGVYKHRDGFVAEFWLNYKKHYIGKYLTEETAALAYNRVAKDFLGDKFIPNEVEE